MNVSNLGGPLDEEMLEEFPYLSEGNHEVTSIVTKAYNCVAHALFRDDEFIWPLVSRHTSYFVMDTRPASATASLGDIALIFEREGYTPCENSELELGYEKVAIYVKELIHKVPTHVARQLNSGEWTSKLGAAEDIRHTTLHALEGSDYGQVGMVLKRKPLRSGI